MGVESTMEALVNGHLLDRIKVSVMTEAGQENCSRKRVATRVVRKRWPPIGTCLAYNKHLECKHQVIITFFCFTAFCNAENWRQLLIVLYNAVQWNSVYQVIKELHKIWPY